MPWELRDYLDPRGRNPVREELARASPAARAKINVRLLHVTRMHVLEGNLITWFKGKWNGICEIRIPADNKTYRLLGCRGPGRSILTLLLLTSKKKRDITTGEKDEALERLLALRQNPERTIDHDFEG